MRTAIDIRSSGFRRYFANTSWLISEKIFTMLISFFVGVYVARYLGPERLGLLSYSQSFVMILAPLAMMGLDAIVVRELVKDNSRRDVLLGTSFGIRIAGTIAIWFILIAVVPFTNNDAFTNLLIALFASSLLFRSFRVIDFYFQANVLSKYSVFARLLAGILIPVVKIGLVLTEANLIWFVLAFLLQGLMDLVFFIIVYHVQKLSILRWRFNKKIAKNILKDSWPLMFSSLMIVVYMKIDQIMLKNLTETSQVGIYAVAVRLSELWYFIPMLITQSLFPAIMNAKNKNPDLYNNRMQQLYDFMTFVSLSLALIITLSSSFIMNTLFGQAYFGSDKVLKVHIWAGIFVFFGVSRGKWIIAENLQKKALMIHMSGAILNVIMNIIFIPQYGALGAAYATLFSYGLNTLLLSILIKELRNQFILYLKSFYHYIRLDIPRQVLSGDFFNWRTKNS